MGEAEQIPEEKLAYFRARLKNRFFDFVLREISAQQKQGKRESTRAAVAKRLGKRPEQITRWLGVPGNWTLDTVSDLFLAISASEPVVSASPVNKQDRRNYVGPEWVMKMRSVMDTPGVPYTSLEASQGLAATSTTAHNAASQMLITTETTSFQISGVAEQIEVGKAK